MLLPSSAVDPAAQAIGPAVPQQVVEPDAIARSISKPWSLGAGCQRGLEDDGVDNARRLDANTLTALPRCPCSEVRAKQPIDSFICTIHAATNATLSPPPPPVLRCFRPSECHHSFLQPPQFSAPRRPRHNEHHLLLQPPPPLSTGSRETDTWARCRPEGV